MSLKDKYSRYGVAEWITLIAGVALCGLQIKRYAYDQLGDAAIELVVLGAWVLLMLAPKSLVNIVRKRGNE